MQSIHEDTIIIKLLAFFVTVTLFVTRFDISKGLLMNGFLLFFCSCLWLLRHKQLPPVSEEIKGYIKGLFVYLVCIIPSILFSDKPRISFYIFCFTLFQYGCFTAIILFIRRRAYLVGMLTAYFLFSGLDGMLTMVQLFTRQAVDNRGYGFGGWLLSIADIMCFLLPVALVILMDSRFEKCLKKSAVFSTLGILVGLLGNNSRGAWLTELIVVPLTTFNYLKKNRKYLAVFLLIILGMVGYMAGNPQSVQRIRSITNITTNRSNADRIWVWKSSKLMIQDHPVTGVGFGRFHEHYEKEYKYEQETQNLPHAHNNFVQVTVESGMIGLIGFLYFAGCFMYKSMQNYRKSQAPYDILVFVIFLAHICLFGQIDYTLWSGAGMHPVFLFLLALLLRLKETEEQFI